MADKRETFKVREVTAVYPKISKPDTYGPKADGKYKTNFTFADPKKTEALKTHLKAKAKELLPKVKPSTIKYPWKTNEETGETSFRAASKFQPAVFDAKNNHIPVDVLIGGGTKMNLTLAYNGYDDRLSLYLNEVQIIALVEYKPKSREEYESSFEATDGYVYEGGSEADEAGDAGETAESGDDGDDALAF